MAIAAKAFIIDDGKLLILKRSDNDIHKPGIWEIPGGRLDKGEDLISGLKREVKEECGIDIEIQKEISIRHFTRDDGQEVEMHIFLCNYIEGEIKLSEEHSTFEWVELMKAKEKITKFFFPEVDELMIYLHQ